MDKLYRFLDNVAAETDKGQPVIRGRAIVYGSLSEDFGGFKERMRAGAFDDSLANGDQFAYLDHNHATVLGRKSAGTLTFSNESDGVYVNIYPRDTSYARDLLENMKPGPTGKANIDKMSFGLMFPKYEFTNEEGQDIAEVVGGIVHEFSVVTEPAFADTMAMVEHSRQELIKTYSLQRHDPWRLSYAQRKAKLFLI